MSKKAKPYAMLCFKCPHCDGLIEAELFKARLKEDKYLMKSIKDFKEGKYTIIPPEMSNEEMFRILKGTKKKKEASK